MRQDPDSQKNLLIAIVLSVGVLLAWQMFYAGPKMKEEQERRQRIQQEQTQVQGQPGAPTATPGASPQPGVPAAGVAAAAPTRAAAIATSARVPVETPSLRGSIALVGGRIDDLVLRKYRETVDPKSPEVVLFSPSGAPHPYYAEYGWVAGAGAAQPLPGPGTVWQPEKPGALTPNSPVTLVWDNGQGLAFRRTFAVDSDYLFTVTDEVRNTTSGDVVLRAKYRLAGDGGSDCRTDQRSDAAPDRRSERRVRLGDSGHPAGHPAASGQWWKAWVLLTSLGATVLGWMAFSTGAPPVESAVVAPDTTPMPMRVAPVRHVSGLEQPEPLPPSAGMLPAMPQKPVFQAPVTRTRRS